MPELTFYHAFLIACLYLPLRLLSGKNSASSTKGNLGLLILTCLLLVITLEFIFAFIPSAHTGGYALSERLWVDRYWKPLNSHQYRDYSIEENTRNESYKNIFFLGDSFTAGHGVLMKETVSSCIRDWVHTENLPFNVYNLGLNNSGTIDERKRLIAFPREKDFLVFQYFGNDITGRAEQEGYPTPRCELYETLPKLARPFVEWSYFINYFYWRVPRPNWAKSYYDSLTKLYYNPVLFEQHKEDILKIFQVIPESRSIVLVYPILQSRELSNYYYPKILNIFEQLQVELLAIDSIAEKLPLKRRVVGANDGHPSAELNRIVCEELKPRIKKFLNTEHLPQ